MQVEIDVNQREILVEHRQGNRQGKDRPMLVRCLPDLRERILKTQRT